MADFTIGAKLSLDYGNVVTTVKTVRQELKLAADNAALISRQFGATSKEAIEAAKQVAKLKDELGDAKSLVDAFNPDTKFRAFGASINTVVGGFTALQGVLGLIGVESEDVQKALLKVQSALAISQGISQLQEGLQTFKNLGAVIQATTLFQKANNVVTAIATTIMRAFGASTTGTATSMNVLKGAIIATGIGALVVLLGVAAQAMGLFSDETEGAAKSQEELKKQIELTNAALERETSFLSNEAKLELANAKRRGATPREIFEIEQKYRVLNFKATERAYNELLDKNSEQGRKLLQQLKDQNTDGQVAQINFETQENERKKQAAEKAAQEAKAFQEKLNKKLEDEQRKKAARFTESGGPGGGLNIGIPKTIEQIQIENEIAARAEARLALDAYTQYTIETDKLFTEIKMRNAQERMDADQAEYDAKVNLANATIGVLGALSNVFGKQTAAAKILALAEIASGTAVAFIQGLDIAQKSAKGTGPAAAFAFPIFYATQIAAIIGAVAKAKSALGGGGPSITGPTTGLATSAPLQPQRAQNQTTQLDQASINALGSATTRAFVLETDVSNNQERVRRLNRAAKLGG